MRGSKIGQIYMIFFILFIGALIGMVITAVAMDDLINSPDTIDKTIDIVNDVYDNTHMPPGAYVEIIDRVRGLRDNNFRTLEVLQEVSIERGRREAIQEVLDIIDTADKEAEFWAVKFYKVREAVMKLKEGDQDDDLSL